MMRPLESGEIVFNEEPNTPPPKLIRMPKYPRKLKSWLSYYRWWLSQQTIEIWMMADCSQPFKRSRFFYTKG